MVFCAEEDASLDSFKSFLRNLVSLKCISILKHTKSFLRFSLDTTGIYIATINIMPCNTDIKLFDRTANSYG